MNSAKAALVVLAALLASTAFCFAAIDTGSLEQPWPKQLCRDYEAGRFPVKWRHKLIKKEGLFAGVSFTAKGGLQAVWDLATDYSNVDKATAAIQALRVREESANRQSVEVELKVLWKTMTLTFEVEKEAPNALRFRWNDMRFGEFKGVALFSEEAASKENPEGGTRVAVSTLFHPYRAAPLRLLLGFQRMAMLHASRDFLEACENPPTQ